MNGIASAFTGRLAADSELKYTSQGLALCSFSVAVDDGRRKEGDPTEWARVTVWEEQAEVLAPRLTKGSSVYIEGRLKLNEYTGKDGQLRTGLNVSAWLVQPLGQIGRRAPRREGENAA